VHYIKITSKKYNARKLRSQMISLSFTKTFKTLSLIKFGCGKLQNGAVTQKQHRLQNEAPNIKNEMIANGICIVRAVDKLNDYYGVQWDESGSTCMDMESSFGPGVFQTPEEDAFGQYRKYQDSWKTSNLSWWWTCVTSKTKVDVTSPIFSVLIILFNLIDILYLPLKLPLQ